MTSPQVSYLLRFDDICPTMRWSNWEPIEQILQERDVRPIMAIVPDNRDPDLEVEPPNPNFWNRVRKWQAAGWTLGIHGFQHTYVTADPGLYSNRKASEFAGLPAALQRGKLERALAILRDEGVTSNLWIAPGHSFDWTTVSVLRDLGITSISDGFSMFPYTDARDIFWIPQQHLSEDQLLSLRGTTPMFSGVFTACLHPNSWTLDDIIRFRREVARIRSLIRTVDEITDLYQGRKMDWMDRINVANRDARRRLQLFLGKPALLASDPVQQARCLIR